MADAAAADEGDKAVALHPLVILNVCDHYTRVKLRADSGAPLAADADPRSIVAAQAHEGDLPVVGALIGVQNGLAVDVYNSCELLFDCRAWSESGRLVLDTKFLQDKLDLITQVYPGHELLGWYNARAGGAVRPADLAVHDTLKNFNESPLYLVLDHAVGAAALSADAKELPIALFETATRIVDNVPSSVFVKVGYKIETVEPERVSVDHVARSVPACQAGGDFLTVEVVQQGGADGLHPVYV